VVLALVNALTINVKLYQNYKDHSIYGIERAGEAIQRAFGLISDEELAGEREQEAADMEKLATLYPERAAEYKQKAQDMRQEAQNIRTKIAEIRPK